MINAGRGTFLLRAGAGLALAVLVTGCGARGADGSQPAPASAAREATVADADEAARSRRDPEDRENDTSGSVRWPPLSDQAVALGAPDAEPRAPLQPDETRTVDPDADAADERAVAVPAAPATSSEPPLKEADSLPELLASEGTAEFERHLAGPWYRLVQPDPSDSLISRMEIIHFEPEQRRMTLFDGDVQEIYVWDVSHRLLATRLGIWVHNELVPSIERTINVEAVTADEIRVVMKGADDHYFDGNYRKLDEHARTGLADSGRVRPGLVELDLAGRYRDSTGQSIDFEPPHFTWQTADERVSGTYAAYSLGQLVIVFKVTSTAGVTRELRTYTADYRERRRGEQLLRSLVLRPARLAITGVTGVGATALHFEKLEALDAATAPDTGAAAAARAIVITPSPANRR